MKLLNFLPREEKFYHMLDELSVYANTSARLLDTMLHTEDEQKIIECGHGIADSKAKAKQVYERLTSEVCRTFITPFDREDIRAFAQILYYIPKLIEKVQDRLIVHKLRPYKADFSRFSEILTMQADTLEKVIKILNNGRKLKQMNEIAAIMDDLEDRGDQLLGQLIAEVFWNISDTRELILRKDLYEMLEDVTDFYRDCANLALQIILKHS